MLKRIKSIDIFRGLCMTWMVIDHLIDWWIISDFHSVQNIAIMIFDSIGASGFLFVSGVSLALSFKRKMIKKREFGDFQGRIDRNVYFFRAFFIFLVALCYNAPIAIVLRNPSYLWTWFVLLTVALSMIMMWPLFYTPKVFRIILGVFIIISNQFLMSFLTPFKGEVNFFGIFYYILYNNIYQDPILSFFPFFLFGTVFGETLYELYVMNDKKQALKKNLIYPSILLAFSLIVFGISFNFPEFLVRQTFSWIFYSIGIEILLLSVLLLLESNNLFERKKSYKFIFYYSYYSLTIYISHNLLYFVFLRSLNPVIIWFFIMVIFILIGLAFREIYKKLGEKASLKIQITRLSLILALKIETKKHNNNKK